MLCDRCVKVDLDDRLRTAADPKNHETCLVCDPGSSLSVMVTQDAVTSPPFQSSEHKGLQQQQQDASLLLPGDTVDALSKEKLDAAVSAAALTGVRLGLAYTITVELWLPSLPPPNQKQALLRFSPPPPAVGRAARRQHASVYVNSDGGIGGPSLLIESRRRVNAHKRALLLSAGVKCALHFGASPVSTQKAQKAAAGTEKADATAGSSVVAAAESKEKERAANEGDKAVTGGLEVKAEPVEEVAVEAAQPQAESPEASEEDAEAREAREAKEAKHAAVAEYQAAQAQDLETKRAAADAELKISSKSGVDASSLSNSPGMTPLHSPFGALAAMAEAWRRLMGPKGLGYLSKQGRVAAQRWCSLTLAVDAGASPQPATKIYVDGYLCLGASLFPLPVGPPTTTAANGTAVNDPQQSLEESLALLGLGRRVVIFGGGKQAEARGGRLRRLRLVDGLLTPAQVTREHTMELMGQNPLYRGAATLIQGAARRMVARQIAHAARQARDAPREGDDVEANYKGAGAWYPGKVTFVEGDCRRPTSPEDDHVPWSCTVVFDDGDIEEHVARSAVRIKESSGP